MDVSPDVAQLRGAPQQFREELPDDPTTVTLRCSRYNIKTVQSVHAMRGGK
jgi:hypothetical protein